VYRVTPDGTVTLLTKEFKDSNGIAFSADEKTLYIANTSTASKPTSAATSGAARWAAWWRSPRR